MNPHKSPSLGSQNQHQYRHDSERSSSFSKEGGLMFEMESDHEEDTIDQDISNVSIDKLSQVSYS